MKHIHRLVAIEMVKVRIKYHQGGCEKADSYSFRNRGARMAWVGHTQRIGALKKTLLKLEKGDLCNRSIAQLFGKGCRVAEDSIGESSATIEEELPF